MAFDVKRVEYYDATVEGHAGELSRLLSACAASGVDLLAYKAVPLGPMRTRLTLLPMDGSKLTDGAAKAGLSLDGPHSALYVRGDEKGGALAGIFERLSHAGIAACESAGLAHIKGGYGVILYLEPGDCERALAALEESRQPS